MKALFGFHLTATDRKALASMRSHGLMRAKTARITYTLTPAAWAEVFPTIEIMPSAWPAMFNLTIEKQERDDYGRPAIRRYVCRVSD